MIFTKFISIFGILLLAGAMGLAFTSTALAQDTSDPPILDEPVFEGATSVTGSTTEPDGTTILLYIDGVPDFSVASVAGTFLIDFISPPLVVDQVLNVTAQAPGEFESVFSSPDVIVQAAPTPQCADGGDNDFDGFIDLDDGGCVDANDDSEITQCQDGLDNDDDGLTDLNDPGCVDINDEDESNDEPPAGCVDISETTEVFMADALRFEERVVVHLERLLARTETIAELKQRDADSLVSDLGEASTAIALFNVALVSAEDNQCLQQPELSFTRADMSAASALDSYVSSRLSDPFSEVTLQTLLKVMGQAIEHKRDAMKTLISVGFY